MEILEKIFRGILAVIVIGAIIGAITFLMFALFVLTDNSTQIDTDVSESVAHTQIVEIGPSSADVSLGKCSDDKFIISDQSGKMIAAQQVEDVPLGADGPCWSLELKGFRGQFLMVSGSAKMAVHSEDPVKVHVFYPRDTATHDFWNIYLGALVVLAAIIGLMWITSHF